MKKWIKDKFKAFKPTEKGSPQYKKERDQARSEDPSVRRKLASKKTTRPEILYYLASDKDESVRRTVAKNTSTPMKTGSVLAQDSSVDVRMVLAKRLMSLLPNISIDEQSQIYAFTVGALATLARDEVLKVRMALSSTLKDKAYTPNVIASRLAKDAEQEVAEPVLRFCVTLSDDDLLEIIADHPSSWVLKAIAQRESVPEKVSDAIIDSGDEGAGSALIENEGARFFEQTWEAVIEKARALSAWQEKLVQRKSLPPKLAKELAGFVDMSLFRYLEKRADLDKETREEVVSVVRRRIKFENVIGSATNTDQVRSKVLALHKNGRLNDELIGDALSWRHIDFVYISIAVLTKTPEEIVRKIIDARKAKPIVSLCWCAHLNMRTAVKIQTDLARVPKNDILLARGGTDYPLDEKEMIWQLDFLGIECHRK